MVRWVINLAREPLIFSLKLRLSGGYTVNFPQALPREPTSLIAMLKDKDSGVRERAAYALGRVSKVTEDVALGLGEALFDTDDEVCIAAAVSLFGCGVRSKPALLLLLRAIQHRNVHVGCLVIATLATIGPDAKDTLPLLTKQMENSDTRVRYWAAQALKSIDPDVEKTEKGPL
jgi:HEAT repeat protein